MSQLGRSTKNNKTFKADLVDSSGREYNFLTESELKLYEDTTKLLPVNFRLPKITPVEERTLAPDIDDFITLTDNDTNEMRATGRVAEVWITARSNCGLVFFTDFSRFTNSSVNQSNKKKQKTN